MPVAVIKPTWHCGHVKHISVFLFLLMGSSIGSSASTPADGVPVPVISPLQTACASNIVEKKLVMDMADITADLYLSAHISFQARSRMYECVCAHA